MNSPNQVEWGKIDKNSLDENCAYEQFYTKSFNESVAMFERNALYYQEDLTYMPTKPFNFYVKAFVKYILSDKAKGDSDGASSFLSMVEWKLKTEIDIIPNDIEQLLISTSKEISNNQQFYEADKDIYGDFLKKYDKIKQYER